MLNIILNDNNQFNFNLKTTSGKILKNKVPPMYFYTRD